LRTHFSSNTPLSILEQAIFFIPFFDSFLL
jgi:hypothetical protein